MKISVIIPTYKPQNYLWDCLASLVAQTFPKDDFEVILVLNGCNEPYKSAIEKYIAEMMQGIHVNLIHAEMPGVSNARNIGLDNAKGEYVAFVDDDDILSCVYLEELYNVSSPTCIGCSNSYCFKKDITEKKDNFLSKGYRKCLLLRFTLYNYRCFLSPPIAKLIHKNIIGDNRFPLNLKKSEDSVFCLRISPYIEMMKLTIENAIYYQREREGSAMRTKQSKYKILKEHIFIMWVYLIECFKHPFKYNIPFVLSRIIACGRNCIKYLKNN